MKSIDTLFVSDAITPHDAVWPGLLVFDEPPRDIIEFKETVELVKPYSTIPPYRLTDTGWTSRAFERARAELPKQNIGCVVVGDSDSFRMDFFMWAQGRGASPIVLLPHRSKDRARQMMDLIFPGYVLPNTWIHLPYPGSFTGENLPGVYTTGEW